MASASGASMGSDSGYWCIGSECAVADADVVFVWAVSESSSRLSLVEVSVSAVEPTSTSVW
eukprot:CAMPEP_0171322810 /NCGR_PEP_ID=MMETSP0816-20121228/115193_1 /TAXON_ID=420281 /ORGANISM="Proboscia inermis, Strain CCAP1064/1" /LENGTH=60 /DNA_ID=CAMNT_0011821379 /DNA_START=832 /DNA_END=1011 /DNA_ORIENTATION=+